MRLRLVSWNVDSRPTGTLDAKLDLLHTLAPDLALLQEVRRPVYRSFIPHAQAHERLYGRPRLFSWGVLSTDLSDPPASDRHAGCAVLGGATTAVLGATGFDPAVSHRAIAAWVAVGDGGSMTIGSIQLPRAAGGPSDPLSKRFGAALAAWLASQPPLLLVAVDGGAAGTGAGETDHYDLAAAGLVAAGCDQVWASPDVGIEAVEFLSDAAAAAGSDRAAIVVDLVVTASPASEETEIPRPAGR